MQELYRIERLRKQQENYSGQAHSLILNPNIKSHLIASFPTDYSFTIIAEIIHQIVTQIRLQLSTYIDGLIVYEGIRANANYVHIFLYDQQLAEEQLLNLVGEIDSEVTIRVADDELDDLLDAIDDKTDPEEYIEVIGPA